MGQINFVSEGETKSRKQNNNNQEKKLEWTNPSFGTREVGLDFKKTSEKLDNKNEELEKTEALSGQEEIPKKGFFSLFGIFKKSKEETLKDKEILAEHKDALLKEKENRMAKTNYSLGENMSKDDSISNKFLNKNRWKAARTLKTDLIKDEVTTFFDWKKNLISLVINSVLILVILGITYGGVIVWEIKAKEDSRYKELEVEQLAAQIQRAVKDIGEIDRLRQELKVASALLDRHIYWTNFFDFLEKNTIAEVTYADSFSGNVLGNYTFSATTDNFGSLVDQVSVMRMNENVRQVQVNKGDVKIEKSTSKESDSGGGSVVNFSMNLSVNPKIFFKENTKSNE